MSLKKNKLKRETCRWWNLSKTEFGKIFSNHSVFDKRGHTPGYLSNSSTKSIEKVFSLNLRTQQECYRAFLGYRSIPGSFLGDRHEIHL